jgi:hypothetical protein
VQSGAVVFRIAKFSKVQVLGLKTPDVWTNGQVASANDDGTFNVCYSLDGKVPRIAKGVLLDRIRLRQPLDVITTQSEANSKGGSKPKKGAEGALEESKYSVTEKPEPEKLNLLDQTKHGFVTTRKSSARIALKKSS